MRMSTRLLTTTAAVAVAAPLAISGAAPASAENPGTFLPFAQILRNCDYSETNFNGPTGMSRPTALISSQSGQVFADVQILTAIPDTYYDVRLIQTPRASSAGCSGSDPGVAAGSVITDGGGAAHITLNDAIEPGAKKAFVFITRPNLYEQDPAEFYTTDFEVPI